MPGKDCTLLPPAQAKPLCAARIPGKLAASAIHLSVSPLRRWIQLRNRMDAQYSIW